MAIHGKGSKVFVNGKHLSAYFDSFDLQLSADTAEKSAFQDTAKGYVGGMTGATLSLNGFFDEAATAADKILADAIATRSVWCVFPDGDAITKSGYGIDGSNNSHQVMSTKDDCARIAAACQSDVGADRIVSILALGSKTSSGSGTVNNNGGASTDGAAYLQAISVTGSVAVKIEHSADNSSWSDLVAFTAVAGIKAERKAITGEIKQYTKVTYTLDGGEAITLQVSLHRVAPPLAS